MNRKEKIDFCNKNIFPYVKAPACYDMDCFEVVKMVEKWRIGKNTNIKMVASVDDGFLFINGEPVGRIAPKIEKYYFKRVKNADMSYYWEGRILARQEQY